MNVNNDFESKISRIAAAIGEPARARMLYSLLDGQARSSTELSVIAEVSASTASVHLQRLLAEKLIRLTPLGRHRYYCLAGADVATALESLSVVAGSSLSAFEPNTPTRLRLARTCYDHLAGAVGVSLHDRLKDMGWLIAPANVQQSYAVTTKGTRELEKLGIDLEQVRSQRRRFVGPCLDWSERRPHLAGSLGASLLQIALQRKWMVQDLDSRALELTKLGRRELRAQFGIEIGQR